MIKCSKNKIVAYYKELVTNISNDRSKFSRIVELQLSYSNRIAIFLRYHNSEIYNSYIFKPNINKILKYLPH